MLGRGDAQAHLGAVDAGDRDSEDVAVEQVIKYLFAYNLPPGPTFSLGQMDADQLAAAETLIKDLVAGKVIAPDEPWMRNYLGPPARKAAAAL